MTISSRTINQVDYKYVVTDLRTNTILGALPFKGVGYSNMLSQNGDFSGRISVNISTKPFNLREVTTPGRTGLYVIRNGLPIWGGIIWKRRYNSSSRSLEIEGATFESYFFKRFNRVTKRWANTDQLQIAREITQSAAADVMITVDNMTSGRRRERSMYAHEFKYIGEELTQLGDLIDGFDWNVIITRGSGLTLNRRLAFFYPERGVGREDTTLSFEYPGSIADSDLSEDADSGANRMWAIGAGDAEEQISAFSQDRAGNWPPLDESRSYKSVNQMPTLQAHANSDLVRLKSPVEVAQISVRADIEPFLGTYNPGDWARFVFRDDYYDPQVAMFMRIIGYNVEVGDNGVELIELTVNTEREELAPGEYDEDE